MNKYNTLVCSEVLEHVTNLPLAITNLNKLLLKKGMLIITVPYLMKHWTTHDDFSGHIRRFEPKELEVMLIKSGFQLVESFSCGQYIYEIYYRIISAIGPKTLMHSKSKNKSNLKLLIARLFTHLLYIEYLSRDTSRTRGRRLFVVAKKVV